MEISFKNTGIISSAKVKFGGLTVIAGENDTGKSTIGKYLFTLINSLVRSREDLEEYTSNKLIELVDDFFSLHTL